MSEQRMVDPQSAEEEAAEAAWAAKETEFWEWLATSAGQEWALAAEATNDAGPTEADLRGEVDHG